MDAHKVAAAVSTRKKLFRCSILPLLLYSFQLEIICSRLHFISTNWTYTHISPYAHELQQHTGQYFCFLTVCCYLTHAVPFNLPAAVTESNSSSYDDKHSQSHFLVTTLFQKGIYSGVRYK